MTRVTTDDGKRVVVSPAVKGSISEHLGTAWLLRHGYDVFRNVSPAGRADLLAVNWDTNETIRVDVKSSSFRLEGSGPRATQAKTKATANRAFDIKYLVVADDGGCEWYVEKPIESANDNYAGEKWYCDQKTGQRFQYPGVDMSRRQWTFFCHWTLKNYQEFAAPIEITFIRDIAARGTGYGEIYISAPEFVVLEKLRRQVFEGLHLRDTTENAA